MDLTYKLLFFTKKNYFDKFYDELNRIKIQKLLKRVKHFIIKF